MEGEAGVRQRRGKVPESPAARAVSTPGAAVSTLEALRKQAAAMERLADEAIQRGHLAALADASTQTASASAGSVVAQAKNDMRNLEEDMLRVVDDMELYTEEQRAEIDMLHQHVAMLEGRLMALEAGPFEKEATAAGNAAETQESALHDHVLCSALDRLEAKGSGTSSAHRKGEHKEGGREQRVKAVKRPAAWRPPPGAKLSRNQIFHYRRRAVEQYAVYLGLDLRLDGELLWLAEEGLYAPVPDGYKEMHDITGTPYYYHMASKTTLWEHPLDAEYRQKLRGMRSIHDLADPDLGKVRSWIQQQQQQHAEGGVGAAAGGRQSFVGRVLPFLTGTLLLLVLLATAGYAAVEVYRVRGLMYSPGPITAQIAGALGSSAAAVEAGMVFYKGDMHVPTNATRALAWFELAAALGDPRGLRLAATVLFKGEGEVAKDMARAAALFHKAAVLGDAFSMSYYGLMHYQGSGVERDDEAAVVWVKQGAEAGDAMGMLVYAVMFLEGRALTRDMEAALKWLLLAKEHGSEDATVLERVNGYMEYVEQHVGPQERIDAHRAAAAFRVR